MIFPREPKRPEPLPRPKIPPAPHLTSRGACSDCHVPAVVAAQGDMKVCPKCYAVLWRRDYTAEQRRAKQLAAAVATEAAAIRRAEKEAQRKLDQELKKGQSDGQAEG
jgi:hypothetical protein